MGFIKRGSPPSQKGKFLDLVEELLSKVPQENRHNSHYFFVKGLFLKQQGSFEKAQIAFKHSFTLNPDFKPAHIEWLSIEQKLNRNKSHLPSFMNIFKKKSS